MHVYLYVCIVHGKKGILKRKCRVNKEKEDVVHRDELALRSNGKRDIHGRE